MKFNIPHPLNCTFLLAGLVLILISCSDYSYSYSGYPIDKDTINLGEDPNTFPWEKITGKIIFSQSLRYNQLNHDQYGALCLIDADTREIKVIATTLDDGIPVYRFGNLTWSQKDNKIVFKSGYGIHSINTDGTGYQEIYYKEGSIGPPACSSDGRIASNNCVGSSLFELWIDNKPFFNKLFCPLTRPAWLPNSDIITVYASGGEIFAYLDEAPYGLYNISTTTPVSYQLLYNFDGFHSIRDPLYTKDGSTLTFCGSVYLDESLTVIESHIYSLQSDGSELKQLTEGFDDHKPYWSPDCKKIVFEREGYLYVMNADGSEIIRITQQNRAQYPIWIK